MYICALLHKFQLSYFTSGQILLMFYLIQICHKFLVVLHLSSIEVKMAVFLL